MQGIYTVTKAAEDRTYPSKYGDMVVWKVRLDNATTDTTDGVFELHKKPGNAVQIGDALEVERSQVGVAPDGSPFVRLFLAKPQNSGGGGSQARGRDDATGQSIERQTAAKVAGEMAAATPVDGPHGAVTMLANFEGFFDVVLGKIQGATSASESAPAAQSQSNGGEVPADMDVLTPAPAGVSDDIGF